jgi:hypothetical protein
LIPGQLRQQIHVAGDEVIFGDDADRVAKLRQHFQTPARQRQPTLDRLVRVGDAGHGDGLRFPLRRGKFPTQ